MVQRVPRIDITQLCVPRSVVLLTVCGHGTPGVVVRAAAYRNKPERCVFYDTTGVEEEHVQVDEGKREAVILECKLTSFISVSAIFVHLTTVLILIFVLLMEPFSSLTRLMSGTVRFLIGDPIKCYALLGVVQYLL